MKKIVSIALSVVLLLNMAFAYTLTVRVKGVELTVTREEGNIIEVEPKLEEIERWEVKKGDITISNNQFTMPGEDVEIEAVISTKPKYTLTVETPFVTRSEEKEEEKDVVVTATSNEKYTFIGWTATGITLTEAEKTSETLEFTMPGNAVTLEADYMVTVKPDTSGANEPVLGTGMTPVNWNGYEFVDTTEANWKYNYNSVASKLSNGRVEGNGNGAWANARTEDGSMWVWIPRYTYKIISGKHQTVKSWNSDLIDGTEETVGRIAVKFSTNTTDNTSNGFIKHPAFKLGDDELKGIWVAKYEMSMEDGEGNNVNTTSKTIGNVLLSDTVKMVSKPGVHSWREISISNMFTNSYNYKRELDSHLMRNTEWGAVAYLTNAIGRIPYMNNNSDCITGISANTQTENNTNSVENSWNTSKGVKAATTHNIFGIYDMSGGLWEYVSAYYDGISNQSDVGVNNYAGKLYENLTGSLSKYIDIYSSEDNSDGAYIESSKGDALYETSSSYVELDEFLDDDAVNWTGTAWDGSWSVVPLSGTGYPVFRRGAPYSNFTSAKTGIFAFFNTDGGGSNAYTFRVTLSVK